MLVSLNSLPTDQLEAAKSVLNWLFVAATFGVVTGVLLEGKRFSEAINDIGWRLLVGCLALETLFTVAIFVADAEIANRQRAEIISLETYLTPRVLTDKQNAEIVEKISSPSVKIAPFQIEYAFSAVNEEEINLAVALSEKVFVKAGWKWIDWPSAPGEVGTYLPYAKKRISNIPFSGIQIRVFNSKLSDVAKTLVFALREAGLDNVRIDAGDVPVENPSMPGLIEVMIGQKPRYQFHRR